MGPESATRYVAAVTIQRWIGRRNEVTRAMRLLGILHALHDEAKGKVTVMHLLQGMESFTDVAATTTVGSSDDDAPSREAVNLLLVLAVAYAERLHSENYARQRICSKGASQLQGAREEVKRVGQPRDAMQRMLLLPDTVLEQLVLGVMAGRNQQGPQRAQGLQRCLDASCITCLSRLVCGVQEAREAKRMRSLWWSLRRTLLDTPVGLNCIASDTLNDVPPLPKPPVVRVGKSLTAEGERESQTPSPVSDDEKDDATFDTSSATADDDDGEDAYSDEKYYKRQKRREEARVARIMSMLQMEGPTTTTTTAAAGEDGMDEAGALNLYMELFGDVGDVFFPTLNAMRRTPQKATNDVSKCCIVCELQDEMEGVAQCSCGSWVHVGCAVSVSNGVPCCSQFCPLS
ncbi:hypothetical protein TraAM80_02511 [Trypanosoma rangeli]|uniref:Uncharacterized protein n=1 Tax=Trypanosoma rangeli TaxID=5698 RepID=A0A422NUF7_TRYRA|nr:uncharacterized protein TraAM80_02511 [Trypanosoma rangeli]RNF09079.1 hypothetical protein TraAM80_02511 [Trypanosoma rangeli]|eukprot:RNF09079.1 hypothetical protein TraAM80_02511 [Trypanosoma rangeli]